MFRFSGTIASVVFRSLDVPHPTGMDRLEMATKMD